MRNYVGTIIGIAVLGLGCFLEIRGVFLYSGYGVIKVVATVIATGLAAWAAWLFKRRRGAAGCFALLVSVVMLGLGWTSAMLPTSPRKRFYILAEQIAPGDNVEHVKARLAGYHSWTPQEGYVSFDFADGPGTSDVISVHYDPKTLTVLDTSLSLD